MILFLTSSPSGCPFEPGPQIPVLDESNGFADRMRSVWPKQPPLGLAIASNPDDWAGTEEQCAVFAQCFANAGCPMADFIPVDGRNADQLDELLAQAGFVMLCGGHVPTQNRFFVEIDLAEKLQDFDGIIMGVSAGSMNAASLVYAQPEEEGEEADPDYVRWFPGLGLTETRILPHYQYTRHRWLDGVQMEDIGLSDSYTQPFLAIPDGSYLYREGDGEEHLYGIGWWFENGHIEEVQGE